MIFQTRPDIFLRSHHEVDGAILSLKGRIEETNKLESANRPSRFVITAYAPRSRTTVRPTLEKMAFATSSGFQPNFSKNMTTSSLGAPT